MQAYSDNPSSKIFEGRLYSESVLPTAKYEADAKLLRRKKARRVWRVVHGATLIALVVYLASRTSIFHRHGTSCHEHDTSAQMAHQIGDWDYDIPKHTQLVQCVQPGEWNVSSVPDTAKDSLDSIYPSEASFDLPLSSAKLFLVSRGANLGGKVKVETSDDQADDSATVRVEIYHNKQEALDWTKVCLLERQDNENGVGVFTPTWRGRYPDRNTRRVSYSITVILPTSAPGEPPLQIKYFETDVPNTVQFLDSLSQDIAFDFVNLRGTNGIVQVESLTTRVGTIVTTNGKITGQLNATDFLSLYTTNGPIRVDVSLTNGEQPNATFVAHTTNSPLKADISLLSSSGTGGTFYISTTTTNGPLAINFPRSPVNSKLNLGASTTNSPASVILHAAYEGIFNLHTSQFFRPSLHIKEGVEDPAGKGRKRRVLTKAVQRGELVGEVQWSEESQYKGTVTVSTTNSPVSLEV